MAKRARSEIENTTETRDKRLILLFHDEDSKHKYTFFYMSLEEIVTLLEPLLPQEEQEPNKSMETRFFSLWPYLQYLRGWIPGRVSSAKVCNLMYHALLEKLDSKEWKKYTSRPEDCFQSIGELVVFYTS